MKRTAEAPLLIVVSSSRLTMPDKEYCVRNGTVVKLLE